MSAPGNAPVSGSLDDLLASDSAWRVPVSSALLRAVASGQLIHRDDDRAMVWQERAFSPLSSEILDMAPLMRSPASCLSATTSLLDRLGSRRAPAIAAIEITDPRPDDAKIEGFVSTGRGYRACEHRFARHALLPLLGSDEAFLDSLGYHTRRNVRNFRRKAEAAGMVFTIDSAPPPATARDERHRLGAVTPPGGRSARLIDRYDAFLRQRADCLTACLRAPAGGVVAFVAAFVVGKSAYVVYQLHERDDKLSWSLVMRSYFARLLIERGVEEMIFPNGCLGLLAAACVPEEIAILTCVRRNPIAAMKAVLLADKVPAHPASEPLRHAWQHLGVTTRLDRIGAITRAR